MGIHTVDLGECQWAFIPLISRSRPGGRSYRMSEDYEINRFLLRCLKNNTNSNIYCPITGFNHCYWLEIFLL